MLAQKTFFLTTIPGLESVTHLELCEKWGRAAAFFSLSEYPDAQIVRGGVEFSAPTAFGFFLNNFMRSNTRMLIREKKFLAPNEKDFIKGLKGIDWTQYFAPGSEFDFKLTSKSSRISMKHQVQKVLSEILQKHKVKHKPGASTIYVRLFRDECNISLDCAGEASFKRGDRTKGSIASLRESTASGLLRALFQGINGPFELIDPMCGSGTFLKEALSMNQVMNRKFDFQSFPSYEDVREQVDAAKTAVTMASVVPEQVFGFDNNERALQVAQKNLSQFNQEQCQLAVADLFKKGQGEVPSSDCQRILVLNPPWGKRLPGASQDVLTAVYKKYRPHRIGFLMPARWKTHSIPLEKTRDLAILNSGVENRFLIFA